MAIPISTPTEVTTSPVDGNTPVDAAEELEILLREHGELEPRSAEITELVDSLRAARRSRTGTQGASEPGASEATRAADAWAEVDLLATFVRPGSLAPAARDRWAQIVIMLPGVLVFAPILITWFGLSRATDAYTRLLSTPAGRQAADGRSFLELWQTGFVGRLSSSLSFGRISVYTVLAIVALIICTALAGHLRHRQGSRADEREQEITGALVRALGRAQRELADHRLASPARFTHELARAAEHLNHLLGRAEESQRQATVLEENSVAAAQQLGAAVAGIADFSAALSRSAKALSVSGDQLRAATDALQEEVTAQGATMVARVEAAGAQTMAHLEAATAESALKLETASAVSAEQLRAAAQAAADRLDASAAVTATETRRAGEAATCALEATTARLATAASSFAAEIRDAVGVSAEGAARISREAVAAVVSDLVEQLTMTSATLAATTARTHATVAELGDHLDGFGSTVTVAAHRIGTAANRIDAATVRLGGSVHAVGAQDAPNGTTSSGETGLEETESGAVQSPATRTPTDDLRTAPPRSAQRPSMDRQEE